MSNRNSKLNWEFQEDDNREGPWPPESSSGKVHSRTAAHHDIRRIVVFAVTMVALLTAGIGAVYARNEAQQGIAEVQDGVQSAVDTEGWIQENMPQLSAGMLIDDTASYYVQWMREHEQHLLATVTGQDAPSTHLTVGDTRFEGSSAAAEIALALDDTAVDGHDGAVSQDLTLYRQTRFYRETPQGWLRTQPLPAFWGPPRELETAHLIWRYQQRDEEPVLQSAQQLDALYARLLQDYGLSQTVGRAKLKVTVAVDYLPGSVVLQDRPGFVTVPSPAVYLAPQRTTGADLLAQAVALAMLESLWDQATQVYQTSAADTVLAGFRLWELQDANLGLSVSTWNAIMRERGVEDVRVACAAYAVWMVSPIFDLPIACTGAQVKALTTGIAQPTDPPLPGVYNQGLMEYYHLGIGWRPANQPALVSVFIDYVVTVYGRESLPRLVAALGQHDSWQTLVPEVYGVSFDEFEAGWREHVARLTE